MTRNLDELSGMPDDTPEPETGESQSKTLIGHNYSNDGGSESDPERDCTDWEMTEEQIHVLYMLNSPNGGGTTAMQEMFDDISEGDHYEWYNQFQWKLAHHVHGNIKYLQEFQQYLNDQQEDEDGDEEDDENVEADGPVPLMEFLALGGESILEYLSEHPKEAEAVYEVLDNAQEDEEPAQAEADD